MEGISFNPSSYCTMNNFIKALQTISEDLSVVGLPPVANYDEKTPGPVVVSLINTIWTLLQHRQRLIDSKRDLELKVSILFEDLNQSKEKQKRLEKDLLYNEDCLNKKKKLALLIEEERSQALQTSKLLKQEVQELHLQLKSKESQFKHDLQRQQNENGLLQIKLRKIISKEKGESWKGPIGNASTIILSNDEQTKRTEGVHRKSICRLENNVQTLVRENLELRKLLDNVSSDLVNLMTGTNLFEKKSEEQPQ